MQNLPHYVSMDDPILHKPSQPFIWPLSEEDKHNLAVLEAKYMSEDNAVGLAAPQIGIDKAAIVFSVSDDPALKRFRKDIHQTMPKTLWLNPSYESVGDDTTNDWEACFSAPGMACLVARYTTIHYTAYDIDGHVQTGQATGFLARVIQHEIDHVHGMLCSSRAVEKMDIDAYREMRRKAIEV